ncbi:MAG: transporter substrate-binding domain-containing protein [Clostridia bacterium]|nr:transporter substrate-binding domain-containing protein [Clostridia bacterium]
MRKFTKVLAVVLAALFVVAVFAGCGKKEESKTYVIYSDNAFAPFEYLDKKSNAYIGIDMDILEAIAKDQGFEYEMHNEGFDPAMGAVQSGQADAMIAGMTITDERKKTFDFADGYYEDGQVLVVKKDSKIKSEADLKGKKVAVKISTMGADHAEEIKDKVGFTTSSYEGSPEMYQAVATGNADACFEDRSVVLYAIANENLDLKVVGKVINPSQYGFAVKKGTNAELIEMFNKGLANIKANGTYNQILAKYGG